MEKQMANLQNQLENQSIMFDRMLQHCKVKGDTLLEVFQSQMLKSPGLPTGSSWPHSRASSSLGNFAVVAENSPTYHLMKKEIPISHVSTTNQRKVPEIIQTTSVADFQTAFEEAMSKETWISEQLQICSFISGLKPELRRELLFNRPMSLAEAFAFARACENQVDDDRSGCIEVQWTSWPTKSQQTNVLTPSPIFKVPHKSGPILTAIPEASSQVYSEEQLALTTKPMAEKRESVATKEPTTKEVPTPRKLHSLNFIMIQDAIEMSKQRTRLSRYTSTKKNQLLKFKRVLPVQLKEPVAKTRLTFAPESKLKGCTSLGYVFYNAVRKFKPKNPYWFVRGRFVLFVRYDYLLLNAFIHLIRYDLVKEGLPNKLLVLLEKLTVDEVMECLRLCLTRRMEILLVNTKNFILNLLLRQGEIGKVWKLLQDRLDGISMDESLWGVQNFVQSSYPCESLKEDYVAPLITTLSRIYFVIFMIASIERFTGCSWIKLMKLKLVTEMDLYDIENTTSFSMVLDQIPMCNEGAVYEHSIAVVCQLDWLKVQFSVRVLIDLDGELLQHLVRNGVMMWKRQLVKLIYSHRFSRTGCKANNLYLVVEQIVNDHLLNFCGFKETTCIWRTKAIQNSGCLLEQTTEGMDMTVRARLNGWRLMFLIFLHFLLRKLVLPFYSFITDLYGSTSDEVEHITIIKRGIKDGFLIGGIDIISYNFEPKIANNREKVILIFDPGGAILENVTWIPLINLFHLEDKVIFEAWGNDTTQPNTQAQRALTKQLGPKHVIEGCYLMQLVRNISVCVSHVSFGDIKGGESERSGL